MLQELTRKITFFALLALASFGSSAATEPAVIPAPAQLELGAGEFRLDSRTRVVASAEASAAAEYFIDITKRLHDLELERSAARKGAASTIQFRIDSARIDVPRPNSGALPNEDERYRVEMTPRGIQVSSPSARGLFHGAATVAQLFTRADSATRTLYAPVVRIEDGPRFAWRGLMLDSARHFQSPEFIKRFIDAMALHKLNVFHWHLVDDQSWRVEIKKYPLLTERGAWRVPAGAAALENVDPSTGKPRVYGGFYTQEEIKDIVAYARARHITIVPEIEMPGHATAAIVAYPQLASTPTPPRAMPADWGIYPNLFNVDEATFAFLEDVLTEVMALFPSPYIHVGGDEAAKEQWQASPEVQARMRALGVKDEHALQSYFIQRMERFLNAKGRRLIGWDEILEGGLAPNATVMSWRGIDGAVAAAAVGHDAVLAPWPTLYFDNRQSRADTEPGRGAIIGVEEVYRFDPLPDTIPSDQQKHVLGVQANLWTEHMRDERRVEYMAFPRAAAVAEIAWSQADRISFVDFERRLPAQLARYEALGIRYAPPAQPFAPSSLSRKSHELDMCSDKLVLSLEDDAPIEGQRATFLVDVMQPCWQFRGVDLSNVAAIEVEVGQVPFNFQIGKDRDAITFRTPRTKGGELDVRAGCEGRVLVSIPIADAHARHTTTKLPRADMKGQGVQDLCFTFAQHKLDPLWVLRRVRLIPREPRN